MDWFLYVTARSLIACLQALPLRWVARLGRAGGALAYLLDNTHRKVALENLRIAFGNEISGREIQAIAQENFKRLGENYACAIKTAGMTKEQLRPHLEFGNFQQVQWDSSRHSIPPSVVGAIGHFGNFELYARFSQFMPGYTTATTYRGLKQASLNRLLLALRKQSGCLFFERRTEANALKTAMNQGGIMLGLLSDQHAGKKGVRVPFFGKDASTSAAPAVFALRYNCRLITCFCFRTGLAQWKIEAGEEIPTHENHHPRPVEAITRDINRAFEKAIRRDPANWFWVHRRWKTVG